jgi:peptidoglycan-N-acetylglucosamine deacetylase
MRWIIWLLLLSLFSPKLSYAKVPEAQPMYRIQIHSHQKVIALTFDDGPHPFNTPQLLNLLKQEQVKATFFVLGKRANRYPTILKRISKEGHEIGNHGYSHSQFQKLNERQISWEIRKTEQIINQATGKKPYCFRSPYGQMNGMIKKEAHRFGYQFIEWSIDPRDWEKGRTAKRIINNVEAYVHTGDIILLHDGGGDRRETIKAVRVLIHDLKKKGYRFTTVTGLMKMS